MIGFEVPIGNEEPLVYPPSMRDYLKLFLEHCLITWLGHPSSLEAGLFPAVGMPDRNWRVLLTFESYCQRLYSHGRPTSASSSISKAAIALVTNDKTTARLQVRQDWSAAGVCCNTDMRILYTPDSKCRSHQALLP